MAEIVRARRRRMNSFIDVPQPTKEPGQLSINIADLWLTRFTPPWSRPPSLPAYTWRAWVANQPVASVCREILIASLESLDWKITPRDMKYRDELAPTIRYYTKLFEKGGDYIGADWTGLLEWICGDLLDLPFGGAAELGRKNDDPTGRVLWVRPLDAGTLYPTLNLDFPVVQYYQTYDVIAFPKHAIARTYMSPSSYLFREGWGIAPPEKVYFAFELLNRGDKYYANLLLDIPTAGIMDLGDMEKSAAEEWIKSFKTFMNDQSVSFKVPVLYEHSNKAEFISLGKVPNDIMFDNITLKYAALVCGAYGVTIGDIGLSEARGGGSLAGVIREERRTRRTGFARVKSKVKYFLEQILPDSLMFQFTDLDDELTVALGRARLATATSFNILNQMGAFSPQELRSQILQDGLITISVPETIPEDAQPQLPGKTQDRPGLLGYPQPATSGGMGEVKSLTVKEKSGLVGSAISGLVELAAPIFDELASFTNEDDVVVVKSSISDSLMGDDIFDLQGVISQIIGGKPLVSLPKLSSELSSLHGVKPHMDEIKKSVNDGMNGFLGRVITNLVADVVFDNGLGLEHNNIVEKVQEEFSKNLTDLMKVFVVAKAEEILREKLEEKDGKETS